jgi:hypothetical protein
MKYGLSYKLPQNPFAQSGLSNTLLSQTAISQAPPQVTLSPAPVLAPPQVTLLPAPVLAPSQVTLSPAPVQTPPQVTLSPAPVQTPGWGKEISNASKMYIEDLKYNRTNGSLNYKLLIFYSICRWSDILPEAYNKALPNMLTGLVLD